MNHHFAVIAVSDFAKDPQFLAVLRVLDLASPKKVVPSPGALGHGGFPFPMAGSC